MSALGLAIKAPGKAPLNNNKCDFWTFASRMGEERTTDLAKSIPAYFRGKLLDNDGQVDIGPALMDMPEYVGFSTYS